MSETSSCMFFIPFIESNNWVTFPLWRDKWFDPLPDFVCFFHTVNNAAITVTNICHQLLSANPFTSWTIKITLSPRQPSICYQLLSVNPFTSWTIKITFNPRQSKHVITFKTSHWHLSPVCVYSHIQTKNIQTFVISFCLQSHLDICHQFLSIITFKHKTFRYLSPVSVYSHIQTCMNSFGILSQSTYTPLTCNHSDTDKSSRFNIVIHMNMWHHSVNWTLLLLYMCSSKHTTTSSQTHCAFLQHVVFGIDERLNCCSVLWKSLVHNTDIISFYLQHDIQTVNFLTMTFRQ